MVDLVSAHLAREQLRSVVVAEGRRDVISKRVEVPVVDLRTVVDRSDELDRQLLEQLIRSFWVIHRGVTAALQESFPTRCAHFVFTSSSFEDSALFLWQLSMIEKKS